MSAFTIDGELRSAERELLLVLETVLLLEGRYAANYVVQVLRGQRRFVDRVAGHTELKVFGALADCPGERIHSLLRWCIRSQWLRITHPVLGFLALTGEGMIWLSQKEAPVLPAAALQKSRLERSLRFRLRQLRTELARYENIPEYLVYTNQMLEQLIEKQPGSLAALKAIPGMGDFRCNRYGGTILLSIRRTQEEEQQHWQSVARQKSAQPAQKEVQALFESGYEPDEIASMRQVQEGSVIRSMEYLHQSGQASFQQWIESQLPEEQLQRGIAYFTEQPHSKLRSAYEAVGLDYNTLRLCRMYVSKVERKEVDI